MLNTSNFASSGLVQKRRLFLFGLSFLLLWIAPQQSYAHASPNSIVFLDVSPNRVAMEVQLPVPELALAFGNEISKDPETLIERFGPKLQAYLLTHIHAYVTKERPWLVKISRLKMDTGTYVDTNIPYWEVNAEILLLPQSGEGTRKFSLAYDVIMHQVINHVALVSVRNDWENGKEHPDSTEATVIGWNLKDNIVPPLEVNLDKGSWWRGFTSMVNLGVEHIRSGTDHLLFLLVLLLPSTLVRKAGRWGGFGGTRYSIFGILKIVTAFTIGHSFTLLLGSLGWVRLPGQPVEILIAFSILISAVHAIRPLFPGKEIFVAAGFGLVHGLAFASTLANLKLDAGPMALSILGFNIGIELMQLFVIAVTVPWLIILSQKDAYKYVRTGGALFAGIAAIAWMVQRSLNQSNLLSALVERIAEQSKWVVFALAVIAVISYFMPKAKEPVLHV